MKPLTDTLKTLITEHSIDILQQEQRLKAMLADLLPHDKQMRFLLELSLRAQIPHKLIAQQNETQVGWEAQIKSLKHYFKDEYFLEDKAVNSVFDCWVEVLPRKKQAAAPPKLGNLNAESKFKDIGAINWVRLAFAQNANWKNFFEESKITNYKSFFNDMGVVKHANHTSSYPKLVLPYSLLIEVGKQPPNELPEEFLFEGLRFISNFQFTKNDVEIISKLKNENRNKELLDYFEKCGFNKFQRDKEAYEKRQKEKEIKKQINSDATKTFNLEQFIQVGDLIGYQLSIPETPVKPRVPEKKKVFEETKKEEISFKKKFKSIITSFIFVVLGILFVVIFWNMNKSGAGVLFFWPTLFFGGIGLVFGIVLIFQLLDIKDLLFEKIKENSKTHKLLIIQERKKLETKNEREYQEDLAFYNNELLPQYEKEYKTYETKRNRQVKDLNEVFPLIVRQIWLQAMVENTNVYSPGNSTNNGTLVKNLVARLGLLFPKSLKVNIKVFDIHSEIILNIDNKICINIEIDEPFNRETSQETHFIGSNDEKRDGVFSENNWFVLRFTESQVIYALSECVAIVQELVQFTQNGNTQHLVNLMQLSKGIETLCWTKEEARLMAMNED